MAAVNTEKIHLGLGTLEIGTYSSGVFQAYDFAGAITATGTITITRTIQDFMTGRPRQTVKREVSEEAVTAAFSLAELTVANIKNAIGSGISSSNQAVTFLDGTTVAPVGDGLSDSMIAVAAGNEVLKFGGGCDVISVALRFTHLKSCGSGLRQIWEFFLASPSGELAMPYTEEDWQTTEVTWNVLSDLTKPVGERFFTLIDEIA